MRVKPNGGFLVISSLSPDVTTARQQIEQFTASSREQKKTDYLVKNIPLTVIPATISYESDEVINYKTSSVVAASISKSELMMILRRDGRHQLFVTPIEVASSLPTIQQQIADAGNSIPALKQSPVTTPTSSVSSTKLPVTIGETIFPKTAEGPKVVEANKSGTPVNGSTVISPVTNDKRLILSDAEYHQYREKALRRVDEFVSYLNIITDKALSADAKDRAIEQATRLFLPESTIEVTSQARPGARRYPIRDYLTRLKLLPYTRANVEWSEIQYVQELTRSAEGDYYGTITGQQTFTGYGGGGSGSQNVLYSDVTQKNVRVKLQSYQKMVDGKDQLNWEVLLGNIGVANN